MMLVHKTRKQSQVPRKLPVQKECPLVQRLREEVSMLPLGRYVDNLKLPAVDTFAEKVVADVEVLHKIASPSPIKLCLFLLILQETIRNIRIIITKRMAAKENTQNKLSRALRVALLGYSRGKSRKNGSRWEHRTLDCRSEIDVSQVWGAAVLLVEVRRVD